MRQLEVVGVSDDGTHVLLASDSEAPRASHRLRIDDRLLAATRGELDTSDRRPSELSPKEIQARLRAGESPDEVAKLAKVPVARVLRYAGPVDSERERIVEQARAAHLSRPRAPKADLPLGEAVDKRLASTPGLRVDSVSWTARRRDDGAWVVMLSYAARGGRRSATWLWQPMNREVTALGIAATRLASDEAAPARRPAAKRTAKPTTSRTTARPARRRAPAPQPAPAAEPEPAPVPRRRRPPQPPPLLPAVAKSSNGRVSVPSWSDVLLGVGSIEEAPASVRPRPARRAAAKQPAAARGRRRS